MSRCTPYFTNFKEIPSKAQIEVSTTATPPIIYGAKGSIGSHLTSSSISSVIFSIPSFTPSVSPSRASFIIPITTNTRRSVEIVPNIPKIPLILTLFDIFLSKNNIFLIHSINNFFYGGFYIKITRHFSFYSGFGGIPLPSYFITFVLANYNKYRNLLCFCHPWQYVSCVSPMHLIFAEDDINKTQKIATLSKMGREGRVSYIRNTIYISYFVLDSVSYRRCRCQIKCLPANNHAPSPTKPITTPHIFIAIIDHTAIMPNIIAIATNIRPSIIPWAKLSIGIHLLLLFYKIVSRKKQDRVKSLNKSWTVMSLSYLPYHSMRSFERKKHQNTTPTHIILFPPHNFRYVVQNVFSNLFFIIFNRYFITHSMYLPFLIMTVFNQNYYETNVLNKQKCGGVYLIKNFNRYFIKVFETPPHLIYYFKILITKPFSVIIPSSSLPSFHPSFSMSSGGITITHLYIDLPLYSRAFCLCSFIKNNINYCYIIVVPQYLYTPVALLYMAIHMKVDIKEMVNKRKARGMTLLEEGFEPKQMDYHTWIVPSQSGCGTYKVSKLWGSQHFNCTCPDYLKRGVDCKHICAVKIWSRLSNKFEQLNLNIKQNIKIKDKIPIVSCKFCHSLEIIKYGKKSNKQVYKCKSCNRKFVDNIDFENMKYNPKIIALTLDLYFRGLSLRKVSSHLKQFYNLDVSYMTVYRWIEKYIGIMNEYVNTIKLDIGDVWHTDEMMVNISGDWEYLWNCMDERTRFQLASVVSKERKVRDARIVFQKAKNNSGGRRPKYIVTDGLGSYRKAINKEFSTNNLETEHLYNVGLQHHPNNNHVERLHGTIREREKTMRGLKVKSTPIVEGHRLYYNFIKPHESLGGKTPSEEAGISIEGDNKWLSLMKVAMWHKKNNVGGV